MKPVFFSDQQKFRAWLEKNHDIKTEVLVGYYKVKTKKPTLSWSASVDEALCFGWIDGVRRSLDEERYQIRFTPRKPGSTWSNVNIKKMEALTQKGLMRPAGLAAFKKRKEEKSGVYIHENAVTELSPELKKILGRDAACRKFFSGLAPGYRKLTINYIMGAKQASTRERRLLNMMKEFKNGRNPWKDHKYR